MKDIVIIDGARTPMAEYNGSFSDISAIDLAVVAAKAALERSGYAPEEMDHVIVGNALLRTASTSIEPASVWREWTRIVCPCCGGFPDIALRERGAQRTLVCARCDAQWRTAHQGCLGPLDQRGVERVVVRWRRPSQQDMRRVAAHHGRQHRDAQ